MVDLLTLREKIEELHRKDKRQLQVVFSKSNRLLVEAPAGYGKTRTMVSRIAYLLAAGKIPFPKKVLAMTFSVNAAYKIRKDVVQEVPQLLIDDYRHINVRDKIVVTNYHGFARGVLRKHGRYFDASLNQFDELTVFDELQPKEMERLLPELGAADQKRLTEFSMAVRAKDIISVKAGLDEYCQTLCRSVTTAGSISYNGILALVIQLFSKRPDIRDFYQAFYTTLIVDEFQDSNWLSLGLVTNLVGPNTSVVLLGDPLQRIYGFIGAVPNALHKAEKKFGLEKIQLDKNYRFASNPEMLALDANLRANAEIPNSPSIIREAFLDVTVTDQQDDEASEIARRAVELVETYSGSQVAILFKQRGQNLDVILKRLTDAGVDFFYGLFTEDDLSYARFHINCLGTYLDLIAATGRLSRALVEAHLKQVREFYVTNTEATVASCLLLLESFWSRLWIDSKHLSEEEKRDFVVDVFQSNGLKQWIEFLGIPIILSTVHAAKGLEWDFVIVPDMEQDAFPGYRSLCEKCRNRTNCKLLVTASNEENYLEELSVFYVAVTRAKKQVYFTASRTSANGWAKNLSCFIGLKGLIWQK